MSEPSETSARTWRPASPAPGTGGPLARRLRLILVAIALLALGGALIGWLLYLRPFHQAHFLPLCLNEYGEELPVRSWARQDAEMLRSLGWHQRNAFTTQKRDLLVNELRDFTHASHDGPLVVYLSAYALTAPGGELCILPVDARPDQPSSWLPLREVFEHMRSSKASHKLLLLDIMQPYTDLRHGVLLNDAAERLQPLLEEVLPRDPNLSVLCACSPGQTSTVAEELGHSVFAYFLGQALRGQADGEGPHAVSDGRVSLRELSGYVTRRVDQWALRHRQARQTPQLYGADRDYPLVAVASTEGFQEDLEDPVYPEWLSELWKVRDRWLDDESYRLVPRTFRQLEAALLRAEQQWRGGVRAERVRQDLAARVERLEEQWREQQPASGAAPRSLSLALVQEAAVPQTANEEWIVTLRQMAARSSRATSGKPDETERKKLETETEQLLKKLEGKPLVITSAVFAAAQVDTPTPASLRFLVDLLGKANVPSYAETRYLARLADLPPGRPGEWPREAIALALRMVGEAEKIAVGDARALPWVREARAAADHRRQQGEALLFSRQASERRLAAVPVRAALQTYQAVNRDLRAVEQAQRCRDEMLVRLPSFVPYLEIDDEPEQAWKNAAATAEKLRRELDGPPSSAADAIRQMTQLTSALRNDPNSLNRLRRPLESESFDKLIGRSQAGSAADGKIMTALLETPWPRADQRVKLWMARRQLAAALEQKQPPTTDLPLWDERQAVTAEQRRGLQRGRRALELLRLEGAVSLEQVEKALESPDDRNRIRLLSDALRRAGTASEPRP
ncbi:MAG TPA: hypothetical protein VMG10_24330 [Gemmataceae bacterium]|nr:hypothetical protein [Gemmataceae bacterium]